MARIRTIKPEIWTSGQFVECSPNARLLFIGLWSFCDDAGRHPASLARIKMEVFPADPFSLESIRSWVEELRNSRDASGVPLVSEYSVEGYAYWEVTGWAAHQKVDQPTYRYPAPDGKVPCSPNRRRTFGECSPRESSRVESSRMESTDRSIDRTIDTSDHLGTMLEPDWAAVAEAASASCRKLGLKAIEERDRRMMLCAHALVLLGRMPEACLADSVEATRQTKARQKNPWAYLQKCLENKAREAHVDFLAELKAMPVPAEMLAPKRRTTADGGA